MFWHPGAVSPTPQPSSPLSRRDSPGGGRAPEKADEDAGAARRAATQQLSRLLKQLHAASPLSWDRLATAVLVDRNTVGNYLGTGLRRRDRAILEAMLDAWKASADARAEVLGLWPATLPTTVENTTPGTVPDHRPAASVIGRVPELAVGFQVRYEAERLHAAAVPGTATVLTQGGGQTVVSGLGGVGKTQLAAHWARQLAAHGEVEVLVWGRAATAIELVTAYAEAAAALGLSSAAGSTAGDTGGGDQDGDARRFLNWLATTKQRWAIVLDNLDDPAAISDWWPPTSLTGRTVITTRRRDATLLAGRVVVDVDVFTPQASAAFLTARLPGAHVDDHEEIDRLAEDLGWLPLALGHAASYMIDQELPCARYRGLVADRRRSLERLFPDPATLFDDTTATVATTWSLSIDAADTLRPRGVASRVLELACHLDPAAIPVSVLTTPAALAYLGSDNVGTGSDTVIDTDTDTDTVTDAIANLRRFSLITRTSSAAPRPVSSSAVDPPDDSASAVATIGMHALVQRAVCDDLAHNSPAREAVAVRAAADAVQQCWPEHSHATALVRLLQSHALALYDTGSDALLSVDTGGHPVLFRVVRGLGEAGLVTAACAAAQRLTDLVHQALGPDHPDTLNTRHNLAYWRAQAGDPTGAATAFEELLDDQLRVLEPDHPNTLTTRGNLAYWRGEAGDPTGAAAALVELLTDQLRVLGPDHPDTLSTRNSLALWRGKAGDPTGAATAFEQLLADVLRVLGPAHPHTLITRNNLARWRAQEIELSAG